MRLVWFLPVFLGAIVGLHGAEFSVQIVDGLNRPVRGVRFAVFCESSSEGSPPMQFESDHGGIVRGSYDASTCKPNFAGLNKDGYQSYGSGFRSHYVLRRQFSAEEVRRVASLDGDTQLRELPELLAGDPLPDVSRYRDLVFYYESRLRPALRTLAADPEVTDSSRDLLSIIGASEDLRLIMRLGPPPASTVFAERWRYGVASALANPREEDEWTFLFKCAVNEFDDHWADAGAILALQLTGSPRSQRVLEEAQEKNKFQARRIERALEYVKSGPPPLVDGDLKKLAERVAQVIRLGDWEGNGSPRFNEAGDKALIDFRFHAGMDALVYTGTFHKVGGVWAVRGARETYQAFAPRALPAPPKK